MDKHVQEYFQSFQSIAQPILNGSISFSCFNAVGEAETFLSNRKSK